MCVCGGGGGRAYKRQFTVHKYCTFASFHNTNLAADRSIGIFKYGLRCTIDSIACIIYTTLTYKISSAIIWHFGSPLVTLSPQQNIPTTDVMVNDGISFMMQIV